MWHFVKEDDFVFLVEDGQKTTFVTKMKPKVPGPGLIEFTFVEGPKRSMHLADFETANEFSKRFDGTLHSRSLFVEKFADVAKELQQSSESEADSEDETDMVQRQEVLQRLPTSTDYMFEQKIIGKAVRVHVKNLVEPKSERKLRDLNTSHVHFLEKSLAECQGSDFVVMAGNLLSGSIEKAEEEGQVVIETIGGNHTRAAVNLLYQKGAREPYVIVTVYKGLTDQEALKVGWHHNSIPGRSRSMSFTEMVGLVKRHINENSMYKKLQEIFGKTDQFKARSSLRTHVKVAKMSPEILQSLKEIENLWKDKNPLCANTIRKALLLETSDLKLALTCLRDQGLRKFHEFVKMKLNAEKDEESVNNDNENSTEDTSEKRNKNSKATSTEVKKLKKKCEELQNLVNKLQKENGMLKKELRKQDLQDKENSSTLALKSSTTTSGSESTISTSPLTCSSVPPANTPSIAIPATSITRKRLIETLNDKEERKSPKSKRKRIEEISFSENEEVEAFWHDKKKSLQGWYKAQVKKLKTDGSYSVLFEDGVELPVSKKWIRKL